MGDITFSIIKPDAYEAGHTGAILSIIEKNGFKWIAGRLTRLTAEEAGSFYSIHEQRPFYQDLCDYMSSGPILVFLLRKENAVNSFRNLIGATDPKQADEGTIRRRFASSVEANAIHGSDSDENARIESAFFFSQREIVEKI
ncbi:MAG: nucleoside-diphosphate kinase [Cytophagales bacterium]|nr:nucleoside-diphosphate kinase [Cytophagales bacterium]